MTMTTYLIAAAITFVFTAILTIAGVGAAFILIPVYYALGIDLRVAMAVALLLNSLAMICAQPRFMKQKLVMMDVALPIIIIATPLSPAGAYVSKFMPKDVLLWMFVAFLVFAASMMIFHHPREREHQATRAQLWGYGGGVGALAGFLGGMLGVLFTVPLRRALVVGSDLKFPEGIATAEVLKIGDTGGGGVKIIMLGGAIGALFKLGESGLKLFGGVAEGAVRIGGGVGYFGINLAPALMAVGYIVGFNIAVLV